ncbi:hypothetical protein N7457_002070 [Penicillium paradoxum]|uniref:uncharacterized protein n=1 Tax=Penicillium paradoxum TaxID=176176 RepID=UPI0025495FB2|nr:uncharacterized protein N7457_002070 [Penicillium paradoxum]KAJ5787080.1 hypothetical protein N7457_002070 [Penicillium paradoxum]
MDVNSPKPNVPKRLSGPFPSGRAPSPGRDPRLGSIARQATGPQTSSTQQTHQPTSTNPPLAPRPRPRSPPRVPPPSIANNAKGSKPTESQDAPSHQGALSISDLVNSLIKVNKGEEQRERLEKEIASITKNLNRAKQAQQFPSTIALFQQQLDAAETELANHVKSITQNQSFSNQAQRDLFASSSPSKAQSSLEQLPERVKKLEFQLNGIAQTVGSTASMENSTKSDAELTDLRTTLQSRDQNITAITEKLQKMETALQNPNGLSEALEYIGRIANSVGLQSKRNALFTARVITLETKVKDVDKTTEEKVSTVRNMVDAIEDEMKDWNKQTEEHISILTGKVQTIKQDVEGKLSSLGADLSSLKTQGPTSRNSVFTHASQLEIDLEAQKRQAIEQIAAQEDVLASLKSQQQNLSDGDRPSSGAATPTGTGALHSRLTSVEQKIKIHGDLLTNIKNLHSEVDRLRLSELATVRTSQASRHDMLEKKQDVLEKQHANTSKMVDDLTKKSEEIFHKHATLDKSVAGIRNSLSKDVQQLQTNLRNALNGVQTRLNAVPDLSQTAAKHAGLIETHSKGIRSLEQRWANITTSELVNSMARAMQEMYPSVDQLAQQFAAHRSEIENRISTLKENTAKAQIDAQTALANGDKSQETQVSPEQLQDLKQLPNLLLKVQELSDKLTPLDELVKQHARDLQSNLEARNDLQNKLQAQDDFITDVDGKVEDKLGEYENFTESINRIQPLTNKVDAYILHLEEFRKELEKLTKASEDWKTNKSEDVNDIKAHTLQLQRVQNEISELTKISKGRTANEQADRDKFQRHVSQLEQAQKEVKDWIESLKQEKANSNQDLEKLNDHISELKELQSTVKGLAEAGKPIPTDNTDLNKLCLRLTTLENQMPKVLDESFKDPEGGLDSLEKELQHLEKGFKGIEESMRGYLKRLRKAEDAVKTIKDAGAEANDGQSSSPSYIPSFAPNNTTTPKTIPMGPTLGRYQPGKSDGTAQLGRYEPMSPNPKQSKHVRAQSQVPSGASGYSLPHQGKTAENRQVQNLKGKRRMSSGPSSDDEGDSHSSSPAVDSSPAPSSSAPPFWSPDPSKKDKKRKKRAAQAEESAKAMKRAKKRKQTPRE